MSTGWWKQWGRDLVLAVAAALLIRSQVAEARVVPSESMLPTLQPGERLIVEKLAYRFSEPKRGDILVFKPPFPLPGDNPVMSFLGLDELYVKRLIGLPGETVEVKGGQVLINGEPLDETYIKEKPQYTYGPVTVPAGKLLMLGDNRNSSYDGHEWGFVDESAVRGRGVFRFWPPSRMGKL